MVGHSNQVLRSPPLSHDRPYGMHLPSAFSMMGRRPGVPLTGADFTGNLTHDPILGPQGSLSSPGTLHGPGGPGWWMPPHTHPHGLSPDFFQSHLASGWLGHEHELSHEDQCLYPTSRASRGSMINGISSTSAFATGSSIFYPPSSNPQSMQGFGHQTSPTSAIKGAQWGNHSNHGRRSSAECDMDVMSPSRRKPNNYNEENNTEVDAETRLHGKEERRNNKGSTNFQNLPGDFEDVQNSLEGVIAPSSKVTNFQTEQLHNESATHGQQNMSMAKLDNHDKQNTSDVQQKTKNNERRTPQQPRPKAPPPPRLNVPKSILNNREGIIPPKSEHLLSSHASSLPSGETLRQLQNTIRTKQAGLAMQKPRKPKLGNSHPEQYSVEQSSRTAHNKLPSKSKSPSVQQQVSLGGAGKHTSKGKSQLIARFRGVTYNEESSDEESNSSDVSSDSDSTSGSGSEDESEGAELEEGGEVVSSGSGSESGGSEEEEDAGEEEDDDDEGSIMASGHGSEGDGDRSTSTTPLGKRKAESDTSGENCMLLFSHLFFFLTFVMTEIYG